MKFSLLFVALLASLFMVSTQAAQSHTLTIVDWNIENATVSKVEAHRQDIQRLEHDLHPDILVLEEVSGGDKAARAIAKALGWPNAYIAVSDFFSPNTEKPYYSQELAVISRIPITSVIEYDARPDSNTVSVIDPNGTRQTVPEIQLTADGIPDFGGGIWKFAKGTIRVDLAGGLSLFPVHLKSERVTVKSLSAITKQRLRNAKRREITIAAIDREAIKAVDAGRTTVILGDFNTGFEPGKFGVEAADCKLQDFPKTPAPFPPKACVGPGYDDTLGILASGLVKGQSWVFLTRNLGRTWFGAGNKYGDFAIDHVAVPIEQKNRFGAVKAASDHYGSDHSPIVFEVKVSD